MMSSDYANNCRIDLKQLGSRHPVGRYALLILVSVLGTAEAL